MATAAARGATIDRVEVDAFTVPTDAPESDGTFEWDSTTIIVVHVHGAGSVGLGYTYGDASVADLIRRQLADTVKQFDAFSAGAAWMAMGHAVRNLGRPGIGSMAISAVDTALWDLKARLLDLPLVDLLGRVRDAVPIYGSGGFTSYPVSQLCDQVAGWADAGITRVKMKVGRDPESDGDRVRAARTAVGDAVELFVDANGAYDRKQALAKAEMFAAAGVTWFEEPVTSDDVEGLRLLRDRGPAAMEITAGEYAYDAFDFRRLLEAGAVDVLMVDATRCAGVTGFLRAAALCESFAVPLSSHTAPALHLHPCAAATPVRHIEWFHDHVRLEDMLFDGVVTPADGALAPDRSRPGLGLELRSDANRYAIDGGRQ